MVTRPAIRIGRWVMFHGGHFRKLSLGEYIRIRMGWQKMVYTKVEDELDRPTPCTCYDCRVRGTTSV